MNKAVVTTTIYRPDNLVKWAEQLSPGDVMCVSGDLKTPHDDVKKVLVDVAERFNLHTRYSVTSDWKVAEVIGWNSIQRRNVAILDALAFNVDAVTTVDTDNFPAYPGYFADVEKVMLGSWSGSEISHPSGWFNVGDALVPRVTHRGFPLSAREPSRLVGGETPRKFTVQVKDCRVGVHASLWLEDPDVDAIERLTLNPKTSGLSQFAPALFTLARDTWCPFNSQSTTFHRNVLPLLNVWPGVGRMDDIWPSYVARHIMDGLGYSVAYGAPLVYQERHPHDLVTDLENELIGYRYTDQLVEAIRSIEIDPTVDVIDNLTAVYAQLKYCSFIPLQTKDFMQAWLEDIGVVYGKEPVT